MADEDDRMDVDEQQQPQDDEPASAKGKSKAVDATPAGKKRFEVKKVRPSTTKGRVHL